MSKSNVLAFPSETNSGMTLRDYFAAKVLQGMYANPNHHYNTHPTDALEAYAMADAMMNFRERA